MGALFQIERPMTALAGSVEMRQIIGVPSITDDVTSALSPISSSSSEELEPEIIVEERNTILPPWPFALGLGIKVT